MFTCSRCSLKIDAVPARIPPFCPRCGTATGVGSDPFASSLMDDDDEDNDFDESDAGGDLPPPPPMAGGGRVAAKTLFGLPSLEGPTPAAPPAKPAPAVKPAPPSVNPPPSVKPAPAPPAPRASVPPPPKPSAPKPPVVSSAPADPFFSASPESPELGSLAAEPSSTPSTAREFEFTGAAGSVLELDRLDDLESSASMSQRSAGVLPEFDGIELPPPTDTIDLPSPIIDATDSLDLPMASGRHDRHESYDDFDLPTPTHGDALDLDLPTPTSIGSSGPASMASMMPAEPARVPASQPKPIAPASKPAPAPPSRPAAAKPAAPPKAPPAQPAPLASVDDFDLDLPTPASDLPAPASNLPTPASNLPIAMDDFPGFAVPDDDHLLDDLPLPADPLPTSARTVPGSLHAAGDLPTPADILPTPVESLGLDLDAEPSRAGRLPVSSRSGSRPESPSANLDPALAPPAGLPAPTRTAAAPSAPAPTTTKPGRAAFLAKAAPGRSRVILYGVLGTLVLAGLVGVYGMGEGWFSEEEPPPTSPQGNEPAPSAEIAERSEPILAKFDDDTLNGYVQVVDGLAEDPVAQAEAALLLHLRYGPDPVRLAQAGKLLETYAEHPAPHVRRVLGLMFLAQPGRTAEALAHFGEDPRSQLYRGWALRASDPAKARAAIEAAAGARPNDRAAALMLVELQLDGDPEQGLAALRIYVERNPNQLSAQLALLRATRDAGLLAEAAAVGIKLASESLTTTASKAELLRLRGTVARDQGNVGEALRLLEQAIASDDQNVAARIDKLDIALSVHDLATARSENELLLRNHPQHHDVLLAAARVALEAGLDAETAAQLATLGGPESTDPVIHELYGDLSSLLLKLDDARKSYAKVRELDPLRMSSLTREVDLLIKVDQTDAALVLLDEQAAKLAALPDQSVRVGAARATVEVTRAGILRSLGKLGPALVAAEAALATAPGDNAAQLLHAILLGELGDQPASEKALEQLHARTGGFPGLTDPLGRMLLRRGQLDELDTLIGPQLEATEASIETLMTGAALRLAQNKHAEAKLLAQRVLDRDSTRTRAHLLLGRALLAEGDYGSALGEIERAKGQVADAEVELWLGQALEYNNRADESRAHYKKAIELEPNNLEAAALLGRLYAYEGAAKAALELLGPVVDETDAYPYAWHAIGLAHRDLGKRDDAVGEFKRARELDPMLFEAYYEEGRILNDTNKHSGAVAALQAGLDKAKANAQPRQLEDAWRRLGDSYFELGQRGDAKNAFEEYLALAAKDAPGRAEVQRLLRDL